MWSQKTFLLLINTFMQQQCLKTQWLCWHVLCITHLAGCISNSFVCMSLHSLFSQKQSETDTWQANTNLFCSRGLAYNPMIVKSICQREQSAALHLYLSWWEAFLATHLFFHFLKMYCDWQYRFSLFPSRWPSPSSPSFLLSGGTVNNLPRLWEVKVYFPTFFRSVPQLFSLAAVFLPISTPPSLPSPRLLPSTHPDIISHRILRQVIYLIKCDDMQMAWL